MNLEPIKLFGAWTEGYAIEKHILKSVFCGEDVFGNPVYDTTRSELGELLYYFKYKNRYDNLYLILEKIKPFLKNWEALKNIDAIIPVPASRERVYQPAEEIATAIGDFIGVGCYNDVLKKNSNIQSKDLHGDKSVLDGTISMQKHAQREYNVLLVDDIYSTGRTLNECVRALREDMNLKNIYVLTITKTKG